ncbi:hypothetical protein AB0T83_11825 [Fluviibacterium sp. DFM31]|uniref:Uncharacterized protein n=1 Tax=Meridianimarinicoccus marinus TaxID=3231483 RepID=A0ABV3L7J1_9RHOB
MPIVPMDIRVNTVESRVRVSDAEALLAPDVLDRIAEAVMERIAEKRRIETARDRDTRVDHPKRPGIRGL